MDYSILITLLRKKQYLTDLEKDILDTWNELQKNPFDMDSAARQVLSNDAKYMDIAAMVTALPTTVQKPRGQITETDLRYNLTMQFKSGMADQWLTNGTDFVRKGRESLAC